MTKGFQLVLDKEHINSELKTEVEGRILKGTIRVFMKEDNCVLNITNLRPE